MTPRCGQRRVCGSAAWVRCGWSAGRSWSRGPPGTTCPVLNRPSPIGGLGGYRSLGGWRHLAQRAGLRILPLLQSSEVSDSAQDGWGADAGLQRTVFTVAGHMVSDGDGDWDEATEAGCARLSQLVGDAVLAVQFICPPGQGPQFCWATQQGDLRLGGSPLLDLLASELT
jgi:hypothetical protein